jgi:deazaflavin-dependent oxidoreductase (nitroreductase family)
MASANALRDVGFRIVPRLHRAILGATQGRLLGSFSGMPIVELHTIGRKTGQRRVTVLAAPVVTDREVVLVASKGGDSRNPEWLLNLQANPEVELKVRGGPTRKMRARIASPLERAELWPKAVAAFKGYGDYQKRTTRDIPMVICTPDGL